MSDGKTCGTADGGYFEEQVWKAADRSIALDSSLDFDGLVANMAELASLAPSWRDHVPHDVAVHFNTNEEYQQKYGPHVDSCALCQQLIESLAPRDDVLAAIMESVEKAPLHEVIDQLVRQLFGPGMHPRPLPMPAFVQSFDAPMPVRILKLLLAAEHSQDPLDQFGAVETCLRWHQPELAYGLLARGLEQCGLEHNIAVRIGNAPRFEPLGAKDLLDLAEKQQTTETGNPIRAVEISAQLGDHVAALRQVRRIVEVQRLKWRGVEVATGAP